MTSTIDALLAPSGSTVLDHVGIDVFQAAVESVRPRVRDLLAGEGNQHVDDVLQRTREILWEKIENGAYEPSRGTLGAFAYGIATRLARKTASRRTPTVLLPDRPDVKPGPLDRLVGEFEATRLLETTADILGGRDWRLFTAKILEGVTVRELATREGLSERTIQDAHSWALCVAATLRRAFDLVDAGVASPAAMLSCVPPRTAVGRVIRHATTTTPTRVVASQVGLSVAETRRALGRARRLLSAMARIAETG